MKIGSGYSPGRKDTQPWEDKVAHWKQYEDRLTDLMETTRSLDPADRRIISDYKNKIHRGVNIRKACRILEKSGFIAARIAGCAVIPVLLIGSAPIAIATTATLFAGMGAIIGSILVAGRHSDNLVGGVPDASTMAVLFKTMELNKRQKQQDEESRKRIDEHVNEYKEDLTRLTDEKDYLPGISISDGQVIISGIKLPCKDDR